MQQDHITLSKGITYIRGNTAPVAPVTIRQTSKPVPVGLNKRSSNILIKVYTDLDNGKFRFKSNTDEQVYHISSNIPEEMQTDIIENFEDFLAEELEKLGVATRI